MNQANLERMTPSTIWSVHTQRLPIGTPPDCILVFTDLYALALNPHTRFADWVGYRVTASSQSGRNSLNRNWLHRAKDLTIEAQDYEHSGFSMGHLCPLASVRADADAWEVNWTGAVAPQRQALNAGPWLEFEDYSRQLARMHDLVYVVAGTLYECDMPTLPESDEAHTVPSDFWARVRVPKTGEVLQWIMPQHAERKDSHTKYLVNDSEFNRRVPYTFVE